MSVKRGPRIFLTDSERKIKRKKYNARLSSRKIYIGDQIDRYVVLRETLNLQTNVDLARTLLDSYEKHVGLDRNDRENKEVEDNQRATTDGHPPQASVAAPPEPSNSQVIRGPEDGKEKTDQPITMPIQEKESIAGKVINFCTDCQNMDVEVLVFFCDMKTTPIAPILCGTQDLVSFTKKTQLGASFTSLFYHYCQEKLMMKTKENNSTDKEENQSDTENIPLDMTVEEIVGETEENLVKEEEAEGSEANDGVSQAPDKGSELLLDQSSSEISVPISEDVIVKYENVSGESEQGENMSTIENTENKQNSQVRIKTEPVYTNKDVNFNTGEMTDTSKSDMSSISQISLAGNQHTAASKPLISLPSSYFQTLKFLPSTTPEDVKNKGENTTLAMDPINTTTGSSNSPILSNSVQSTPLQSVIPTATSLQSVIPTATFLQSVIPTATSLQSVIPTATSFQSVIPTATSLQSVNPTATSLQSVNPTATFLQSVIPTATSLQSVNPTATSLQSVNPTATSLQSVNPTATSLQSVIPTSSAIAESAHMSPPLSNGIPLVANEALALSPGGSNGQQAIEKSKNKKRGVISKPSEVNKEPASKRFKLGTSEGQSIRSNIYRDKMAVSSVGSESTKCISSTNSSQLVTQQLTPGLSAPAHAHEQIMSNIEQGADHLSSCLRNSLNSVDHESDKSSLNHSRVTQNQNFPSVLDPVSIATQKLPASGSQNAFPNQTTNVNDSNVSQNAIPNQTPMVDPMAAQEQGSAAPQQQILDSLQNLVNISRTLSGRNTPSDVAFPVDSNRKIRAQIGHDGENFYMVLPCRVNVPIKAVAPERNAVQPQAPANDVPQGIGAISPQIDAINKMKSPCHVHSSKPESVRTDKPKAVPKQGQPPEMARYLPERTPTASASAKVISHIPKARLVSSSKSVPLDKRPSELISLIKSPCLVSSSESAPDDKGSPVKQGAQPRVPLPGRMTSIFPNITITHEIKARPYICSPESMCDTPEEPTNSFSSNQTSHETSTHKGASSSYDKSVSNQTLLCLGKKSNGSVSSTNKPGNSAMSNSKKSKPESVRTDKPKAVPKQGQPPEMARYLSERTARASADVISHIPKAPLVSSSELESAAHLIPEGDTDESVSKQTIPSLQKKGKDSPSSMNKPGNSAITNRKKSKDLTSQRGKLTQYPVVKLHDFMKSKSYRQSLDKEEDELYVSRFKGNFHLLMSKLANGSRSVVQKRRKKSQAPRPNYTYTKNCFYRRNPCWDDTEVEEEGETTDGGGDSSTTGEKESTIELLEVTDPPDSNTAIVGCGTDSPDINLILETIEVETCKRISSPKSENIAEVSATPSDGQLSQKSIDRTSYAVKIFQDWHEERTGMEMDMKRVSVPELATTLVKFYRTVRPKKKNKAGKERKQWYRYCKNTLRKVRFHINRHLANLGRNIDIIHGSDFNMANQIFENIYKPCLVQFKGAMKHEELSKLTSYFERAPYSPVVLRHYVWYTLYVHFVRKPCIFFQQMKFDSVKFGIDEMGEYAKVTHKGFSGLIRGNFSNYPESLMNEVYGSKEKVFRIEMLKLLIAKTDPSAEFLFNDIDKSVLQNPKDATFWYKSKRCTFMQVKQFMSSICEDAKTNVRYAPLCVRDTVIEYINKVEKQRQIKGLSPLS